MRSLIKNQVRIDNSWVCRHWILLLAICAASVSAQPEKIRVFLEVDTSLLRGSDTAAWESRFRSLLARELRKLGDVQVIQRRGASIPDDPLGSDLLVHIWAVEATIGWVLVLTAREWILADALIESFRQFGPLERFMGSSTYSIAEKDPERVVKLAVSSYDQDHIEPMREAIRQYEEKREVH